MPGINQNPFTHFLNPLSRSSHGPSSSEGMDDPFELGFDERFRMTGVEDDQAPMRSSRTWGGERPNNLSLFRQHAMAPLQRIPSREPNLKDTLSQIASIQNQEELEHVYDDTYKALRTSVDQLAVSIKNNRSLPTELKQQQLDKLANQVRMVKFFDQVAHQTDLNHPQFKNLIQTLSMGNVIMAEELKTEVAIAKYEQTLTRLEPGSAASLAATTELLQNTFRNRYAMKMDLLNNNELGKVLADIYPGEFPELENPIPTVSRSTFTETHELALNLGVDLIKVASQLLDPAGYSDANHPEFAKNKTTLNTLSKLGKRIEDIIQNPQADLAVNDIRTLEIALEGVFQSGLLQSWAQGEFEVQLESPHRLENWLDEASQEFSNPNEAFQDLLTGLRATRQHLSKGLTNSVFTKPAEKPETKPVEKPVAKPKPPTNEDDDEFLPNPDSGNNTNEEFNIDDLLKELNS